MSAAIVAFGAISGLGRGDEAFSVGDVGSAARVTTKVDEELAASKLARPFCSRAELAGDSDRATAILRVAMDDVSRMLDTVDDGWRDKRVGLALATSSGGMRSAEELFRALHVGATPSRDIATRANYFAPMVEIMKQPLSPATLVLTACAASTIAIGIALGWLEGDRCDLVIAGGFDAVSVFVASGFETLRATTSRLPSRPFGLERDGMALGEGAALVALARSAAKPFGWVTGFGASGDAVHVTAPDRTGAGLARAAKLALGDVREVDLVSAHGTATPFNDAAEWKAINAALGESAMRTVVHPFKAQIGHTLGAAGALESLAALDAIRRNVDPASVIASERDPETPAKLAPLTTPSSSHVGAALKLSAAFGGANASLVVRTSASPSSRPRAQRDAFVSKPSHVGAVPTLDEVCAMSGVSRERLARADELVFLALAAIAGLARRGHSLAGAGVVIGHAYATVDVNDKYDQRILERNDARAAEPRRFPYTSPNAVAGECSVAFGLTGPNLAVGSGLHGGVEALAIAADLVRAGDADQIVAVAVDAPRRAARAIAAACDWPIPRDGAVAILVSRAAIGPRVVTTESSTTGGTNVLRAPGHEALLPLATGDHVASCTSPWGAFARVVVEGDWR